MPLCEECSNELAGNRHHDILMQALSSALLTTIYRAEKYLQGITEEESGRPVLPGGWSRRQVLGHLIDSASNNHQRFVRAALEGSLTFPGYEQASWSRIQFTQDELWAALVTLWASYNRHLAHVIAHLPDDKLDASCIIGDHEPVTLRFLAEDYLRHLSHHLEQILPVSVSL
jgi:hypothetical protein